MAAKGERTTDAVRLNAILGDDPKSRVAGDMRDGAEAAAKGKGTLGRDASELLCWAAGNGRTDLVKALLKRGADASGACTFDLPPHDPHDEEYEATEADWFAQEYEPTRVVLRPLGVAAHAGHADAA